MKVSVIGCGRMGSAFARALRAAGRDVTGCDVTPERLEALAADGIEVTDSAPDAIGWADLVMLNVPTYEHVSRVIEQVTDVERWRGVTVANLVTGTPEEARACRDALERHGAVYLDGAILSYPDRIGTGEAMIMVSGPASAWDRFGETFRELGGASIHVGDDVGAANVLDVAMAGAFYGVALGALAEAAGYVRAQGIDLRMALPAAKREAEQLLNDVEGALDEIASGDHRTEQATLDVWLDAIDVWHGAMAASGQRAALIAALRDGVRRAQAVGLGSQSFFAQVEVSAADHTARAGA